MKIREYEAACRTLIVAYEKALHVPEAEQYFIQNYYSTERKDGIPEHAFSDRVECGLKLAGKNDIEEYIESDLFRSADSEKIAALMRENMRQMELPKPLKKEAFSDYSFFLKYDEASMELIAAYELAAHIVSDKDAYTRWWGDVGLWKLRHDVGGQAVLDRVTCALDAIGMRSVEEFIESNLIHTVHTHGVAEMMRESMYNERQNATVQMPQAQEQKSLQDAQSKDTFSIYQIKASAEMRPYLFHAYSYLRLTGLQVDRANYEYKYTAALDDGIEPEDIFARFNLDLPKDFKGRSLSVSDVVVMRRNGQDTAYYVDTVGFTLVPEFLREQKEHTPTDPFPTHDINEDAREL